MTINPAILQTSADATVFSAYHSLRTHHGWEAAGPLAVTPDYAGLEIEPCIISEALIVDAFMEPRTTTTDHYPATMTVAFNPNSTPPGSFEKMINTDAVLAETAAFNAAAQALYVFNHAPTTYVEVPITGSQVFAKGFGFRKFYADRLVDGDTDGPYALDLNGVAEGSYVTFKFSEDTYVTKITMWMSGAGSTAEFQLQGSADNGTYTDLLDPSDLFAPTLAGANSKTFENTTGYKYYRLVLADGAGTHTVTVYEVSLYSIPQVLIESDEVPPASSEVVSARFVNLQEVATPLTATYTFPVAQDWAVYNMAYVWIKSSLVNTPLGTITFQSTDMSTVDCQLLVTEADTWTRIKCNLNTLVLSSGVNDVTDIVVTTVETKGVDFTLGALTVGETLELVTRKFEASEWNTFRSDSASLYLFFTTTDVAAVAESDLGVRATPQVGMEVEGTWVHTFQAGLLADADDALANKQLYAAKFSIDSEMNGNYYVSFFITTALADLKVVGWAYCREV